MHELLEGLTLGTPHKYGHTDAHMFDAKEQAPLVRKSSKMEAVPASTCALRASGRCWVREALPLVYQHSLGRILGSLQGIVHSSTGRGILQPANAHRTQPSPRVRPLPPLPLHPSGLAQMPVTGP